MEEGSETQTNKHDPTLMSTTRLSSSEETQVLSTMTCNWYGGKEVWVNIMIHSRIMGKRIHVSGICSILIPIVLLSLFSISLFLSCVCVTLMYDIQRSLLSYGVWNVRHVSSH